MQRLSINKNTINYGKNIYESSTRQSSHGQNKSISNQNKGKEIILKEILKRYQIYFIFEIFYF